MKGRIIPGLIIVGLLVGCSSQPTIIPTTIPTYTALPTYTPFPTSTPNPTETNMPEPTNIPEPTNMPEPLHAKVFNMTLEEAYKEIYALGYGAEMLHHDEGYWLVDFYDLSSYFTKDGWYWHGNEIILWAGGSDGKTNDAVDQLAIMKNVIGFPVSGLDGKADHFFRNILHDLGFADTVIDEIIGLYDRGLVDARDNIDERICYGQLSTGEYIAVWLMPLDVADAYTFRIDIRTAPMCTTPNSNSA